jgi:hypothetical protein
MQFLVKQVHTPEQCPKDRGGSTTLYDAGAPGVKLDRILGDFPRHVIYYLLEAERVEDVQKFLDRGGSIARRRSSPSRTNQSLDNQSVRSHDLGRRGA